MENVKSALRLQSCNFQSFLHTKMGDSRAYESETCFNNASHFTTNQVVPSNRSFPTVHIYCLERILFLPENAGLVCIFVET